MRYISIILTFTILFACSQGQQKNHTTANSTQANKNNSSNGKTLTKVAEKEANNSNEYLTSTYDNPKFDDRLINHRESLKRLSDKNVFFTIDSNLKQALTEKHQQFFKSKDEYELIFVAKGDLFQENREDNAFVVYDKKNQRVAILVYNKMTDKYSELYRDLKVENGFENANCNYGAFGTLDYQLANEIVYQEEYLFKKPEKYLESTPCKIADISKDEDFILKSGCFSKKTPKDNLSNSLCIATSSVYNNWECLKYDKQTNTFLIYYGQAFAD